MPDELMGDLAGGEEVIPEGLQNEGGETPPVEGGESTRQYVEIDDPDNRFVRVKVAGEETDVPFSELQRGYSREADYTRKTQELAQQREQLGFWAQVNEAMQIDPEATLQLLARQYGITPQQVAQQQQVQAPAKPQFDDPLEEQLWETRQQLSTMQERWEQEQADRQLSNAIGALQQQNGATDEDVRAVVQVAMRQGLGVEAFPMIYQSIAYQRLVARAQASQMSQQQKQQETQQRQAAAAAAGQMVTSGSGAPGSTLTDSRPSDGTMSLQEAALAALEQHGTPSGFDA